MKTAKRKRPDMPISKEKLKDHISILEVARKYSPKIRESTRLPLIICPFHQDKNLGSCRIYPDTNTFKCESCGAHGDTLRLASGYLDIPLSDLNRLLEALIVEFGIPKDAVSVDYNPKGYVQPKPIERLSPDEYKELLHDDHYTVPTKFELVEYERGEYDYVPCEHTKIYYRTLATKDPEFHDWVICTVSRIYWLRYAHMLDYCQKQGYELLGWAVEEHLKEARKLLYKALTDKSLYRPELRLRNELLGEELSNIPISA